MKNAIKKLGSSFFYALSGIMQALRKQQNLRIDFFVGGLVLFLTFFLPLSTFEILWVVFSVFLVIVFEMLNSLIESLLDLFYPFFHEEVKKAKDLSAGIVLVTAVFAISVGLVIFGKHLFQLPDLIGLFAFFLFLVTLLLLIGKGMTHGKNSRTRL